MDDRELASFSFSFQVDALRTVMRQGGNPQPWLKDDTTWMAMPDSSVEMVAKALHTYKVLKLRLRDALLAQETFIPLALPEGVVELDDQRVFLKTLAALLEPAYVRIGLVDVIDDVQETKETKLGVFPGETLSSPTAADGARPDMGRLIFVDHQAFFGRLQKALGA